MVSLSIVISVYNQKDTLGKVLAALARQIKNPKDFEVVITDDGSTDGTAEFVRRTRFPIFMKYLQAEKNAGRAENRNRGFAKTVGGHVLFLDGDMVPGPDLMKTHMAMWKKYSDDVILGAIKNPPGYKRDSLHRYLYSRGRLTGAKETAIPGRYLTSNNFSVNREAFEKLGGFDESFTGWGGEDTDLGLRLESEGIVMRYAPEAVCYHYHIRTLDDVINEFERYGRTGYRQLIEKHPGSVLFPGGWKVGLPDSKPGLFKKVIGKCLAPLRSDAALKLGKKLYAMGSKSDIYHDWLFYGSLARGYNREPE